jgi:hypothetical protein
MNLYKDSWLRRAGFEYSPLLFLWQFLAGESQKTKEEKKTQLLPLLL